MNQVCNGNAGRGVNLADLVADEPWHRPLWTQYIPTVAGGGGGRGGGGGSGGSVSHPDNSQELSRQIQTVVQNNKRLQQNVDRLQSDQRRAAPTMYPPQLHGTHIMDGHRGGTDSGGFGGGGKAGGKGGGGYDRDEIKRHRGRPTSTSQRWWWQWWT